MNSDALSIHMCFGGARNDSSSGTLHWDRCPGGLEGKLEVLRGAEGVWDCQNVVKGTEYDGICHRSKGNGGEAETNVPGWDKGPGGLEVN